MSDFFQCSVGINELKGEKGVRFVCSIGINELKDGKGDKVTDLFILCEIEVSKVKIVFKFEFKKLKQTSVAICGNTN